MMTASLARDRVQSQQSPAARAGIAMDRDIDFSSLKPDPLECGDTGKSVAVLQLTLKQLEFYNQEITGQFDERTADAVRAFQDCFGLKSSGKFDPATWYALTFWAT
ncbi:MAG: peptidoglycan-binding domain-containing protein [Cyanobacteria bacterium J06641_5]